MKTLIITTLLMFFVFTSLTICQTTTGTPAAELSAASGIWVSGYIASWTLNMGSSTNGNYGNMPYQNVDMDAMTHIIMFAAGINADGSISYNNIVSSRRKPFNDYAHSKGKPVILSLGGAGNTAFSSAISAANRTNLVRNLLASIRTEKYDGLDIDIEPVNTSDTANISLFVRQLYDSLKTMSAYYDPAKRPVIVAAVYNQQGLWARLSPYLAQINIMTYDFFGTWFGKSWHNNAPYGASGDVDVSNTAMTTVQSKMKRFLSAGIPAAKLGVGIDFDGYLWKGGMLSNGNGVTAPRQLWNTPPAQQGGELPYWKIVRDWEKVYPGSVRYDNIAKVPYIGVDNAGNASDYYLTYQDASTAKEIIRLTRSAGIGGVILWEVGAGYFSASDFPGLAVRDPLLRAVKEEAFGGVVPPPPVDTTPPTVDLTAPAAGSTVGGTVLLRAQASDNVGVSSVQFYVNGAASGSAVTTSPYEKSWTTAGLANGSYLIRATATDGAGLRSSDSASVIVSATVPGDIIPPAVSLTAPASRDTVSGSVQVNVSATDASGISTVKFRVDGAFTGAADASSPYAFTWNSASVADGLHTLAAEATDGAGLTATGGLWVYVKNAGAPPPQDSTAVTGIYGDKLVSPWINASWGSVITYSSTERVLEGSYAVKSVQNAWGAIMLHSGSWSAPAGLQTSGYDSLRFAVYPEVSGLSLAVWFGNDIGGVFPKVTKSNITAGRWTFISIPVAALNPGGQIVHRLNIQNNTSGLRTYHVDRVVLGEKAGAMMSVPVIPPASASITPGTVTFTDLSPEGEEIRYVTVANEGEQEFRIDSVASTLPGISVFPSGGTIAPHDSMAFTITAASRSRAGTISGFLVFSHTGEGRIDSVLVETTSALDTMEASATRSGIGGESVIPDRYSLSQNYPNPFNPTTIIGFGLPQASRVTVRIYDVSGREVNTLFEGELGAGFRSVQWDGRNGSGAVLATGVYLYRIEASPTEGQGAPFVESKRMLFIK